MIQVKMVLAGLKSGALAMPGLAAASFQPTLAGGKQQGLQKQPWDLDGPEVLKEWAQFGFLPDYLAREAVQVAAAYRARLPLRHGVESTEPKLCACLEGLPGSGKSTTAAFFTAALRSNYAGSDVGPKHYPPLEPDPSGRYRITLGSLETGCRFFTAKELQRSHAIFGQPASFQVLDRSWISEIVHVFAVTCALRLPDSVLGYAIDSLADLVGNGSLYFPHWLVIFDIPIQTSYRKVVHRDGRFFGENMATLLSVDERQGFLEFRAEAYHRISQMQGLPVKVLSYRTHPVKKLLAVLLAPTEGSASQHLFFEELRAVLLPRVAQARTLPAARD